MKKLLIFTILFSCNLLITTIDAQTLYIQWQRSLGGEGYDHARSVQQTSDGGYVVAGFSSSDSGDVSGNQGGADYWIVKLNDTGSIQWQKCLGGTYQDNAYSIQQTTDKGYIIAGNSSSNDSNVTGNHGLWDYWIVKLDSVGTLQWQKSLGGTGMDAGVNSIQQTPNGGYIVAGQSNSNNGNVTGNHGTYDYWVVKLDSTGVIEWQKSLGGTTEDRATSIRSIPGGGYIVAGYSFSNDGNVTGNHGNYDYWIVKLNDSGVIQWQKCLGGTGNDNGMSICLAADGGCVVTGTSNSNAGDVTGNHGAYDNWVVKLDTAGTIQWERSFGGTGDDKGFFIQQTSNKGYIVAGSTSSNDGDVTGNHGDYDYWIIKLDSLGAIEWKKALGGTGFDQAFAIQENTSGGYIIAGESNSTDGEVTGNHGFFDNWIVMLDTTFIFNAIKENENIQLICVAPNPSNGQFNFKGLEKENTISVYDITGRLIYQTLSTSNEQTIDLSEKNKGLYFYKIINSKNRIRQGKIIVE